MTTTSESPGAGRGRAPRMRQLTCRQAARRCRSQHMQPRCQMHRRLGGVCALGGSARALLHCRPGERRAHAGMFRNPACQAVCTPFAGRMHA